MGNREMTGSGQAVALAFFGGVVAGVVAALLLAPKSGEESRRAVKGYAKRAEEEILEKAKEARTALDETIERGKHFIAGRPANAEAPVKAGRETMKGEMDKCCS